MTAVAVFYTEEHGAV